MLDFGSSKEVSQVQVIPHVFGSDFFKSQIVFRFQVLWPAFELWVGDVPNDPWQNKKCFEGQYSGLEPPFIPFSLESIDKGGATLTPFVNCVGVGRYLYLVLPGARHALRLREITAYGPAKPLSCNSFDLRRGCGGRPCANLAPAGWGKGGAKITQKVLYMHDY